MFRRKLLSSGEVCFFVGDELGVPRRVPPAEGERTKEVALTPVETSELIPIHWLDGRVRLIDQTRLPSEECWLELSDYREVVASIREMRVRGAPAIGVAGAYATAMAALEIARGGEIDFISGLEHAASVIKAARPTGANPQWAVQRMLRVAKTARSPQEAIADLIREAERIHQEDEQANRTMGKLGATLLPQGIAVLTHCNTGALATGGYGTALGIIRTAWEDGRISEVFATETRPLLQGARLTTWELRRANIGVTLVPDSAAGELMRRRRVQTVIVGADRIAANGDVANKIGTYGLAVLAAENDVQFLVAAPTSTVDASLSSGDLIPIEERSPEEVTRFAGTDVAPDGVAALNLAFDITPHRYVSAIVTELGVAREPYERSIADLIEAKDGSG